MTNNSGNTASHVLRKALAAALATTLGLGIAGCAGTDSGTSGATVAATSSSSAVLAAPSDLEIDLSTGDFSFTANDEGVGYYFLRVYENVDGVQGSEYVATSTRINGGGTGEMHGSVDLSSLSYATYNFNLVSAAASGSGATAPETQVFTYQLGVGGTMERPELMVLSDGSSAELYVDYYTLSDWYAFQRMPELEVRVSTDAAGSDVVRSETVDLSGLAPVPAAGPWASGTNWATDADATHRWLVPSADGGPQMGPMAAPTDPVGTTPVLAISDLGAGSYYVTVVAKGSPDGRVSESQPSDAVGFSVTEGAPTGEFEATTSSLWQDPVLSGPGATATEGSFPDRVDFALSQTTTGELVK